jgi:hypothetical protein
MPPITGKFSASRRKVFSGQPKFLLEHFIVAPQIAHQRDELRIMVSWRPSP